MRKCSLFFLLCRGVEKWLRIFAKQLDLKKFKNGHFSFFVDILQLPLIVIINSEKFTHPIVEPWPCTVGWVDFRLFRKFDVLAASLDSLSFMYLIVCLIIYKIFIILDKTARSNVFSRNKWKVYKTAQIDSSMSPDALTQIGLTIKFLLTFRMYICKKNHFKNLKARKKSG